MAYLIAILMAALSFLLNRFCLYYIGSITVISTGPVVEETAKTLFAYYLGADIMTVHVVFGMIEAGYDWWQGRRGNLAAPFFSIGGHSLFGAATAGMLSLTGGIWGGLAAGLILHMTYNVAVIKWLAARNGNNSEERDNP
ncbi:hypothetical protein [Sporomusa acidovorans]|uniref:Uncharacterized protein n=1 Tax=Sporomusa acidovorans (strain ATCC 49682 / DSM 3132 / Mol) TaxID=1123286 RepID=A0ABZ3IWF9_SPOA4|nr:hypothetical protein [Sporomusa acidovorans]OZC23641.1 hypothetical protein SPACI_05430 [Sporomusa acidovorans DSM 3132]SDE23642.1 hypothetical protein SAMN04488499_101069 [Sporomusa acidovorans]